MSSKNYLDKNGLTYFWGKVQNEISPKANTSDVLTKTNTTSYTPSANYHPATKKYVDDKEFNDLSDVFIIECTTENNEAVVDKTWTEITTAYNAGKKIFAKNGSAILQLLVFHPSSNSSQGYIGFIAPYGSFNPDAYFNQWYYENGGLFIWDTTWSGQGGEMDAWDAVYFENFARAVTEWTDPTDSNKKIIQRLVNDYGNSIFMERYAPNGYGSFNLGSSTTLSASYYDPSVTNNITLNSSGLSITSTAGVSIQNVVTPTNNTDAATKGYVDNVISSIESEDSEEILNLLSEFGYVSPFSDADGKVVVDADNKIILG